MSSNQMNPFKNSESNPVTVIHKLNAAHFMGSLLVAGLVGWVTGSPTVFLIALVASLIAGSYAGDIRR